MAPPEHFPNFPHSPGSRLALGCIELLKQDAALAEYFEGRVLSYEIRDLLVNDTLQDRTLAVIIDSALESKAGSNKRGRIEITLAFGMVHAVDRREGTGDYIFDRVANHLIALLEGTDGQIHHEHECVSDGIERHERPPAVLIGGGSMILHAVRTVFVQHIRRDTRELV